MIGSSEVVPVIGGRLGARHLAAARPDRLRRPPARAHRDRAGDRLRGLRAPASAERRLGRPVDRAARSRRDDESSPAGRVQRGVRRRARREASARRRRARSSRCAADRRGPAQSSRARAFAGRASARPGSRRAAGGRRRDGPRRRELPVGAVGEPRRRRSSVEQAPQLGERIRRVLDAQLDPRPHASPATRHHHQRRRLAPAARRRPSPSAASSAASRRRASGPLGGLERRGHRRPDAAATAIMFACALKPSPGWWPACGNAAVAACAPRPQPAAADDGDLAEALEPRR